jgi:hypothetical protein
LTFSFRAAGSLREGTIFPFGVIGIGPTISDAIKRRDNLFYNPYNTSSTNSKYDDYYFSGGFGLHLALGGGVEVNLPESFPLKDMFWGAEIRLYALTAKAGNYLNDQKEQTEISFPNYITRDWSYGNGTLQIVVGKRF